MDEIRFGTDGWRGVMGWDFTADRVKACAQGVARYLTKSGGASKGLVVGYDTRFGSDRFAAEVAQVTTANGIPTMLCDRPAPTPVASYNIIHQGAGGGVIITASHNPPEWNGFKYKPDYAGSASPEVVQSLEGEISRALQKKVPSVSLEQARSDGLLTDIEPAAPYVAQVNQLMDLSVLRSSGLTVFVDAMYGAGVGYLPGFLEGGKVRCTELHGVLNPAFPGIAQPEPVAHNLLALSDAVVANRADVGIALDGDADRVGLVDEKGRFISTLHTFALLALYFLEVRGLRGPLVKSITMSSMVYRLGELYQVPVYETPVGFKYISPVMMGQEALAAGEESGGYAFRGHIPERDGILSGLYLLDLLSRTGRSPSELMGKLVEKVGPHFFNRLDVPFRAEQRIETKRRMDSQRPETLAGLRVTGRDEIDGVRFHLQGGAWVLVRFSGTEPLLRIYAEASSQDQVDRLLEDVRVMVNV